MKVRRLLALLTALALPLMVLGLLLFALDQPEVSANPGTLYVDVSDACIGASDCYSTIQEAVDDAVSGDEIRIATGVYTDVVARAGVTQTVYISKSLILEGGYTNFGGLPDPESNPTVVDGQGLNRVLYANGNIDLQLEGLEITNGWITDTESGSGIYVYDAAGLVLRETKVYSNVKSGTFGVGAGVYVNYADSIIIEDSHVFSNASKYAGGGIYIHNSGPTTIIDSNVIGNDTEGNGGGIYIGGGWGQLIISNNLVEGNNTETSSGIGGGGGAGLYIKGRNNPIISNNRILSNTAGAQGGGLYLNDSRNALIENNVIQGNIARNNGGGVYLKPSNYGDGTMVRGNIIRDNQTTSPSGGTGGGISVWCSQNAMSRDKYIDNVISGNNAANNGGGIQMASCQQSQIINNRIHGNNGGSGDGVFASSIDGTRLTGNEIYENGLVIQDGIYLYGGENVHIENNIIRDHPNGKSIFIYNGSAELIHNTIARNNGISAAGVVVHGDSVVTMTNNIVVSNTTGIKVSGGTVTMEATLWGYESWANTNDILVGPGSATTGTVNIHQEPGFLDPDNDDLHLNFESPAIDQGVSTDVTTDFDGDSRVFHAPPDIGADEHSCLVMRDQFQYHDVQSAVDAINPSNLIRVAGTCYGVSDRLGQTQQVYLTKTLTIKGGYNTSFTRWNPKAYPTTLDAQNQGRVLFIEGSIAPTIESLNIINGKQTTGEVLGGGIWSSWASPIISNCQIMNNIAPAGAGLFLRYGTRADIVNTYIMGNHATNNAGGVFLWRQPYTMLKNVIVADNVSDSGYGTGIALFESKADLLNTTFANNSGGFGYAINLMNYGVITATNTIVSGHEYGVNATGISTATLEATLWDNTYNTNGAGSITTGTVNIHGDPEFVDAENGNYHLMGSSPAIDKGVMVSLDYDIDGQPRPFGADWDIGADEYYLYYVNLPLVLR